LTEVKRGFTNASPYQAMIAIARPAASPGTPGLDAGQKQRKWINR
jgi:hypothetical protein